jgi:outer membrane cobalamin receptor
MSELYGLRGQTQGNPDLVPESAWIGDLSVRVERPVGQTTLSGAATGFIVAASDQIVWVQNAQRTLVPVNLGASRTAGVEATAAAYHRVVTGSAALTFQDARQLGEGGGRLVPAVPRWQIDVSASARPVEGFALGLSWELVDGLWQDAANVARLPTRSTVDGWAQATFPGRAWPSVLVGVRNLGDQRTGQVLRDGLNPSSGSTTAPMTDYAGWPLPGRTVWGELRWTFGGTR